MLRRLDSDLRTNERLRFATRHRATERRPPWTAASIARATGWLSVLGVLTLGSGLSLGQAVHDSENWAADSSTESSGSASDLAHRMGIAFAPGLEPSFVDGIEDGDPSVCEAPVTARCWWVDAAAPDGGDGSFAAPFNSFEVVAGYRSSISSIEQGLIEAGDHLYVTGVFSMSSYDNGVNNPNIFIRSISDFSGSDPIVIKSWKGLPRAIFDGEKIDYTPPGWEYGGMVYVDPTSSLDMRIENIEIRDAHGSGIIVVDNVEHLEIANVIVHDTIGNPSGTAGGMALFQRSALHDYTVRNSVLYRNSVDEDGNVMGLSDNLGALSMTSNLGAQTGSTLSIYNNTFTDEVHSIRHKHSGNVHTDAFFNVFENAFSAVHARSRETDLHHNVVENVSVVLVSDAQNQNLDTIARIFHNTILDADLLVGTGSGDLSFRREFEYYDNIFFAMDSTELFHLARWSNEDFDLSGWRSGNNIYVFDDDGMVLYHEGVGFLFDAAMSYLGEENSSREDPLLTGNLVPSTGSPACGAASDGGDIGAFSCTLFADGFETGDLSLWSNG
ncbi:MAG: hypothetical protein MPN21_27525 [Thermoanaerobaculia bacterium]|nr:hypothetical protein [Thermoanaerobaculia bacterium]